MAKNFIFKEAEYLSLPVPAGTRAGKPVRIGALNAITVTDEGAATQTIQLGAGVSITQPSGGIGNAAGFASVALHGAAELDVLGATLADCSTLVHIKIADNTLTTTPAAGTRLFGVALRAKGAALGPVLVKVFNSANVAPGA